MVNAICVIRRTAPWLALIFGLLGVRSAAAQTEVMLRFERGSIAELRVDEVLDSLNALIPRQQGTGKNDTAGFGESRKFIPSGPKNYELQAPPAGQRILNLTTAFAKTYWQSLPGMLAVLDHSKVIEPRTGIPNDPALSEQWHLAQIEALAAWNYTRGGLTPQGQRIVIGVIEANGFDLEHPELRGQYYVNPGEIANNNRDDDGNGLVDDVTGYDFRGGKPTFEKDRHGAHVAAILAGASNNGLQTAGLNADARLIPFEINSLGHWISALDYLTSLRLRFNASEGRDGAFVVAVNCSLGAQGDCRIDGYEELNLAIDRAGAAGILTVGAVSNQGENQDVVLDVPSSCTSDYLITVTATTRQDSVYRASGYSRTQVDLGAPGEALRSIDLELFGRIDNEFNGTSGATPLVTGALALLYGVDCGGLAARSLRAPAATALELKAYLLESVDISADLSGKTSSGGRLNIRRAIESLLELGDCNPDRVIVQYADSPAPARIVIEPGDTLKLLDTISADWNIYRYAVSTWRPELPAILAGNPNVKAVEQDVPLIGTGQRYSFAAIPTDLEASLLPEAREQLERVRSGGIQLESVQARFDLAGVAGSSEYASRLLLNTAETDDNGIDDDANGFVDDFAVTHLGAGTYRGAAGYAINAAAMLDLDSDVCDAQSLLQPSGKTLQLQGHSYGDWLKGAAFVYARNRDYYANNATRGVPITVYGAAVRGDFRRSQALPSQENLAARAVASLLSVGILTVLPSESHSTQSQTLAALATGAIQVSNDQTGVPATEPYSLTARQTAALSCNGAGTLQRFAGTAVGISEVSTLAAALRSTACRSDAETLEVTASLARHLRDALTTGDSANVNLPASALRPRLTTALYFLDCSTEKSTCQLLSFSPNPITRGFPGDVYYTISPGSPCPATILDVSGRIITRLSAEVDDSYKRLSISTDYLPAGTYFIRLGDGKEARAYPFIVLD